MHLDDLVREPLGRLQAVPEGQLWVQELGIHEVYIYGPLVLWKYKNNFRDSLLATCVRLVAELLQYFFFFISFSKVPTYENALKN